MACEKLEIILSNSDEAVARIVGIITEVTGSEQKNLVEDFPLMAGEKPIDSFALVEICVRLEDLASELGFEFDWTSEHTMSRSRSIFLTVGTLANEFLSQKSLNSQ